MKALVTGATGFIGTNLCLSLIRNGVEVVALTRSDRDVPNWVAAGLKAHTATADMVDEAALRKVVCDVAPDVVFHLASTAFNPPPTVEQHFRTNVAGTRNLVLAAADSSVKRIVFTGTAAQYGAGDNLSEETPCRPDTDLGITKQGASVLLHGYGLKFGIQTVEARLFTPYGPFERSTRLVPYIIRQIFENCPIELGAGDQERDWLYIDDVISALLCCANKAVPAGSIINVSSGQPVAIKNIARKIRALMGSNVEIKLGAKPTRPDEIWKLSGPSDKARSVLGWEPSFDLEGGLSATIDWMAQSRSSGGNLD